MTGTNKATQKPATYINPQESLRNIGRGDDFAQDISTYHKDFETQFASEQKKGIANPEFKVVAFDKVSYRESHDRHEDIQRLQATIAEIQNEVKQIRAYSQGLTDDVNKIERAALQALPEKVGVYHVRYYEMILQYLRGLKAKVGEAKTWLMAMQSKKAKRGSAFGQNTKKKGTQYSLSQELQVSRSVG